jgi:hypothetical protein
MLQRWSPAQQIVGCGALFVALSATTTWIGSKFTVLVLNENQILYLFSTTGQVLAGIYGLTLTAFIFFRGELSRAELDDETLADAVANLKRRNFILLLFITVSVVATILLANLAIAAEDHIGPLWNAILINSGQSAFATCLFAIVLFTLDLIAPGRIASASRSLQEEVDPAHATQRGSLEDFVRNYNQLQQLLEKMGSRYLVTSNVERLRRTSNTKLAEILLRNEQIDQELYQRLRNLITLRNSIIHGADPVVSDKLVLESERVLAALTEVVSREFEGQIRIR